MNDSAVGCQCYSQRLFKGQSRALTCTHDHVPQGTVGRHEGHCGGRAKILLVDDDEEVRTITCDMVGDLGYKVSTAATGEEALLFPAARESGKSGLIC